ncbi:hypothetical protein [Burkholderia sp. BCC0405]|uniref:immunity protein Imm33 domain-containing protein n=1 Tax=Burkholderia sp. BCC0405 TaxID=2676298 RepID=UPI001ABA803C|nr:hypothetical protein [Burkholderia sp. BCC0405]
MTTDEWSALQNLQRETCAIYGLSEVGPEGMVAVAFETLGKFPVHGERVMLAEGEKISWYFYCGNSSAQDRKFKPIHTEHLGDVLPSAIKFLRMPPGSGFMIDSSGNEEVWVEKDGGIEVMKIEKD